MRATGMADDQAQSKQEHKGFFISYTNTDRRWAEWIAWQLEEAGYHTIIQAWDIRPGSNFVAEMNEAAKHALRTIPVLSPAYLEWPTGQFTCLVLRSSKATTIKAGEKQCGPAL
jgi:TIR domain